MSLSLFKKERVSYYGSGVHKYVDKIIRSERNILIISPYIDDYYANYLAGNSHGKKAYVLSSSIRENAAKRFGSSRAPYALGIVFLLFLANAMLSYFGVLFFYLALASLIVAFFLVLVSLPRGNEIYLKVPKRFVHAKMYVGDRMAIEGSANLTYAGMHQNVERVNIITDPREIGRLKRQFWRIWNSV